MNLLDGIRALSIALIFFLYSVSIYPICRFVLPHIKSYTASALFHFAWGLVESLILYGRDTAFVLLMSVSCYYSMIHLSPLYCILVALSFVTACNYIIYLRGADWSLDMSGTTMVIVQKVWSLSFNLQDGRKILAGQELKRPRWTAVAITETPSLLAFLAYCLTPLGSFSGPFLEFKLFDRALKRGSLPDSEISEDDRKLAKFRFFGAFAWGIFAQTCLTVMTYESVYLGDWYLGLHPIVRSLIVPVVTGCLACRYFPAWWLVEAGFAELGLPRAGIVAPDEISNLSMFRVLQALTVDDWFRKWNYTTHLFWKNYMYTRLLALNYSTNVNWAVFILSMVWHGFKPVYFAMLPEEFFCLLMDRLFNRRFPMKSEAKWTVWPLSEFRWDVWGRSFLIGYSMLYATATFFFPWMYQFWHVRKTAWFMPDVVYLVLGLIAVLLPRRKKEKGTAEKPKGE